MKGKKIIIILVFVALIIGVVMYNSKKSPLPGSGSGNNSANGSDSSKGYYSEDKNSSTKDQSKQTISEDDLNTLAAKINRYFTQDFYEYEAQAFLKDIEDYLFTRADVMALKRKVPKLDEWIALVKKNNMGPTNRLAAHTFSWYDMKSYIPMYNQALKKNGVEYTF